MTLSVLPVEIWRGIVKNNLHAKHDWLSLSRTSSFFVSISQEALYNDIFLTRNKDKDGNGSRTMELFTRSMKERPELARLVRHLRLTYEYYAHPSVEEEELRGLLDSFTSHPILSNLAWFTMLCHLCVEGFLIDRTLVSAIQTLPRLTAIEFTSCVVSETLSPTDSMHIWSETSVSTVSINFAEGSNTRAWACVCPAGMRALVFEHDDPLVVDGAFSSLLLLGITVSLTRLSLVSCELPPNFIHFLSGMPQLRCLKLPYLQPDMETLHCDTFPPDIVPFLEHFEGPADLCENFIKGRPVHSLKLKFKHNTPTDILLALHSSAAPVTKLKFYDIERLKDRHNGYLMHAPTSIISFRSDGLRYPKDYTLYFEALLRLTNLAVVTLCLYWIPPNSRRPKLEEIVYEYSEACPSLREVRFKEERWRLQKHGGWERFMNLP